MTPDGEDPPFVLPGELQINAWMDSETGAVLGKPSDALEDWTIARKRALTPHQTMFAEEPPDLMDWREVGWGLVLPECEGFTAKEKAIAKDAPQSVQDLLHARGDGPVFRYRNDLGTSHLMLYERSGTDRKVAVAGGDEGTGVREMPKYLLIVGSPATIPWRLQYVLNPTHFVGRLDLDEPGLENYVTALIDDWSDGEATRRSAVIWSVDKGEDDITWTMRHGLAERVYDDLQADADVTTVQHLPADQATHAKLVDALKSGRPGLVVTTSHGATPIKLEPDELRKALGRPVDQTGAWLSDEAVEDWEPGGAIWYAHACCSAGADASSLYRGVAQPGSDVEAVLAGVASGAGAITAPLPRRLLGRPKPLAAFVGHVEPTFNWTLRDPDTGQPLTASLRNALYNGLFRKKGEPIGLALARHYAKVGSLWGIWDSHVGEANAGTAGAVRLALAARLAALDRQSVVILGDPVVTLPQD